MILIFVTTHLKSIMIDIKLMRATLDQLETEKGLPREKIIDAIEQALAAAYKKDYGKKGQIVRAKFSLETGQTEFFQVKIVVDPQKVKMPELDDDGKEKIEIKTEQATEQAEDEPLLIRFNPEQHILLDEAKKIKKDAVPEEEIIFPLESQEDYGRIAAQTAKQVIIQRIREAEKDSVMKDFGDKKGQIVNGTVQRIERGNLYIDLGRATGLLSYNEQIVGEKFKQGERIRAYLYAVEDTPKGVFLRLSRSHPKFIEELFKIEAPEVSSGVVEIKNIAREAGSRSKIAVYSNDEHVDPVGSCVGPKGVRVSTIMSELGGEKIDIIEWSDDTEKFISGALSPASILSVKIINEEERRVRIEVLPEQLSLAIGKGGQNVRLAAKLTNWKLDIQSTENDDAVQGGKYPEEIAKSDIDEIASDDSDDSETIPEDKSEATSEESAETSKKSDELVNNEDGSTSEEASKSKTTEEDTEEDSNSSKDNIENK